MTVWHINSQHQVIQRLLMVIQLQCFQYATSVFEQTEIRFEALSWDVNKILKQISLCHFFFQSYAYTHIDMQENLIILCWSCLLDGLNRNLSK